MAKRTWQVLLLTLISLGGWTSSGCSGGDETPPANASSATGGDAADPHAGHDHAAAGPHDGHVLVTSDDHFHAEWTHSDDGKVTVYILDSTGAADHPINAESVDIETSIEGGESKTYSLAAVGEQPATAFEVIDAELLHVLKIAGEGASATLKFSAEGKDVTATIEHEDHSGHKH